MAVVKQFITPANLDTAYFELDQATKKIKVKKSDQVKVPTGVVSELNFDNATKQITFKLDGVAKTVDMTPFLTDIHVSGATLEGKTLKLQRTDGQGDVTVDLAALFPAPDVGIQDAFGETVAWAYSETSGSVPA